MRDEDSLFNVWQTSRRPQYYTIKDDCIDEQIKKSKPSPIKPDDIEENFEIKTNPYR